MRSPQFPALSTMLEKMTEGIAVEGMESLLPQLVPGLAPLTALLPRGRRRARGVP